MIHLVRPAGVDDPRRPSGGNVYDRRIASALGMVEHASTATVPDGAVVLVDGLCSSPALLSEASRLRVVVLVHMPRWEWWEGPVLQAAAGVVTTSRWSRDVLASRYGLDRVAVAEPGVDPAPVAENFKLSLIDLHRAQIRASTPRRWRDKDLAALYFSALDIGLTRRDVFRFLIYYFDRPLRGILQDEQALFTRLAGEAERLHARYLRKYVVKAK